MAKQQLDGRFNTRVPPQVIAEIESVLLEPGQRNELDETIKGKEGRETLSEFTRTAWALLIRKRRGEVKGRPRKEYPRPEE